MSTYSLMTKFRQHDWGWARLVSDFLSPPFVWTYLALPIALLYTDTVREAWLWSALFIVFVCWLPVLFIAWMVHRGKIGDLHMQQRHERYRPLVVSLVTTALAYLLLLTLAAPPVMPLLALFTLGQLLVVTLVTLFWQISVHAMGISSAAVACALIFGYETLLISLPVVMLVGAARFKLKRHTPMQVFFGAMVGTIVPVLMLLLLPLQQVV